MKTFKEHMNEAKLVDEFKRDIEKAHNLEDTITKKGAHKLLVKSDQRLTALIDDWTRPNGKIVKTVSPQITLRITKSGKTDRTSWIEVEVKSK